MSSQKKNITTGNRQAKQPKNNKQPKKRKQTRFKPGPSKATKSNLRSVYQTYAKERAFFERVVTNMLLLDNDYLHPREDGAMTCSKLVKWTTKLPLVNIDSKGSTSYIVRPNPDRLVEFVNPPQAGNKPKDSQESLTIQSHMENPNIFYFDHDLTMTTGSITAEKAGGLIQGAPPGSYYSETDKALKAGIKIYRTGPFVANLAWSASFKNNSTKEMTVKPALHIISSTAEGGMVVTYTSTFTMVVAQSQTGVLNFPNWGTFASKSEDDSVIGFALTFESTLSGDSQGDSTISNHANVYSLVWPIDTVPVFGQAYTWASQTLWDIKGTSAASLKAEWDNANVVSVTGCDMNLANFSANMNLNGSIFGTIVKDATHSDPPSNPLLLYDYIDDVVYDAYRMEKPITADDGVHSVLPLSDKDCAFAPTSLYKKFERQADSGNFRPYFVVSVICDSPVTVGSKPSLELSGTIHLEWRTSSILCSARRPATNIGFFNQVKHQMMLHSEIGKLWTHNPDHLAKFKAFGKKIVNSKMFRTVLRDAAEVGIESLASLLLV